jgi:outer membrane protein OmpA-like peptidoglycan-associated protein
MAGHFHLFLQPWMLLYRPAIGSTSADETRLMKMLRLLSVLLGLAALAACAGPVERAEAPGIRTAAPSPAPVVAPPPVAAPLAVAAKPAATRLEPVVVYFGLNRDDINASTMQLLYEAVRTMQGVKLASIRIQGYTDGSGHRLYNQKLSERRARAVALQLKKLGLDAPVIEVTGFAADKPAVRTGKNAQEARNRRVEITFEAAPTATASAPETIPEVASVTAPANTPVAALACTAGDTVPESAATPATLAAFHADFAPPTRPHTALLAAAGPPSHAFPAIT